MYFFNFYFMCLYIGTYLYFQLTDTPMPEVLRTVNVWASWGFLLWGAFLAGRVIVDCMLLSSKGQMSSGNAMNGVFLALLNFLPTVLMSVFMLKEGFVSK